MTRACDIVAEIFAIIRSLKEATTILLVDQNERAALAVADRAYVLEVGRISIEGRGSELPAIHGCSWRISYFERNTNGANAMRRLEATNRRRIQ